MEATRSWVLFYETTKDLVDQFYLGHPKKMVALTTAEIKNDNNDATLIARLAHTGFLPQAHISTLSIRELRDIVRLRGFLVNQRRGVRNQIQTLLDRNIWPSDRPKSFKSPFCKKGLSWLDSLKLSDRERFILDESLSLFHELNRKIETIYQFLQSQSLELPGLKYLRSAPGFRTGGINAYCLLIEISDITRFNNSRGLLFYSGLIPREHSSGEKQRKGRLVKSANLHLRTVLIESTLAAIRQDKTLKAYYKNLKARNGSGAAIIATARKLCCAIYYVLKEQKAYDPSRLVPSATACHSSRPVE
jgi:transposase